MRAPATAWSLNHKFECKPGETITGERIKSWTKQAADSTLGECPGKTGPGLVVEDNRQYASPKDGDGKVIYVPAVHYTNGCTYLCGDRAQIVYLATNVASECHVVS